MLTREEEVLAVGTELERLWACKFETPSSSRSDTDDKGFSDAEDFEVHIDLTDDLLHTVFSFLNHVDMICRSAMVCRQWRVASAREDFWKVLNFENLRISIEQSENMSSRYPNATEVNVYGAPAATTLRYLSCLTLDMHLSIRCPQLRSLSVKRSNMSQAMLNCPLLQLLDIASCHKLVVVDDAAIRSSATFCPQLETIDVSNCSCVRDETFVEKFMSLIASQTD